MEKRFKLLKRNKDCVLLYDLKYNRYKVVDVENDSIFMGEDEHQAQEAFDKYDLDAVHAEQKQIFEQWLKENAQA